MSNLYQGWTQAVQYQTPRRPTQPHNVSNTFTPVPHIPAMPYYAPYPPQMFDPRLYGNQISSTMYLPPALTQTSHLPRLSQPQATPIRPSVQINSATQQLSPIQQSPVPVTSSKRKRTDGAKTAAPKRARQSQTQPQSNNENINPSSVPGVSPSSHVQVPPASHPRPISNYSPITKARKAPESKQVASDVWYFMRPLEDRQRPMGPLQDPEMSRKKPKSPFVGCRLCPLDTAWSVWSNINGMADTIHTHLSTKHGSEWRKIVAMEKLKGWEKSGSSATDKEARESFMLEGFLEQLARWVAVDDQSLNVVETQELRDLLLYLNADLKDEDIPHRTKLTQVIFESYHREWKKLVSELQNSEGRIAFTSDLWSDTNLRSFMAITGHFSTIDEHGNLITCNCLLAFRHISGTHSGAELAKHFMAILKELGIVHKISTITLDNASNCGTMMEDLEQLLRKMGILFDSEGNRIRCFPHVINIAVKAALRELSKSAPEVTEDTIPSTWEFNENKYAYANALDSDIVAKARSLVGACRASGQRREDLQSTIREGNASKSFPDGKQLRSVELLRDMDVRWSSTFLMIDRVLELYPAIDILLNKIKYKDIHHHLLDDVELQVLSDIATFLKVLHAVQTTLCAEKTPTLSAVLPTYEDLLVMLRSYQIICPQLKCAIVICTSKIEEYVNKSRKTRVYALAMIINPMTKLKWIIEHWSEEEQKAAKDWMLGAMFDFRKANRTSLNMARPPTKSNSMGPSSTSCQSQASGLSYIRTLKASLQRSASQILAPPASSESEVSSPQNNDPISARPQTEAERQAEIAMADEKDRIAVAEELQCYIEEGVLNEEEYKDFSLMRYWQARKYHFPTMYRVAVDILPIQASSVACERVFSSSKETITMCCNCLSVELMEVLQFLKYVYRQDRLNLMEGLISSEHDLMSAEIASPSIDKVRDLLVKGHIDQLIDLLNKGASELK